MNEYILIHYSVEANEYPGKRIHSICLSDVLTKFLMCSYILVSS